MLTDAAAVAAAERLKANAGARVHRIGEPDELTEEAMPTGVYERKKPAAKPAEPAPKADAPAKKKPGRKPRAQASNPVEKAEAKPRAKPAVPAPIFSVDSTGAVLIRRGDHGMEISREEAIALHDFMHRADDIIVTDRPEGGAIV